MPTRNVNLTDHFDQFVAAQIEAGNYRNASEVMRDGLRLLERQQLHDEQKLRLLRKAVKQGFDEIDQGRGIELASREELEAFMADLGRHAKEKAKKSRRPARRAN